MSQTQPSFANPIPAGLGSLAVACFAFGAMYLGKVTLAGYPLLAAWLIGGGIVQVITAVIELKNKNITGGNVFLFFSAFFMFSASLSVLAKFAMILAIKKGMVPAGLFDLTTYKIIEGYCWLGGASFITVIIPSYIKAAPKPLTLMIILLTICLWIIVALDLQLMTDVNKFWHHCVGYLAITSGFLAIYLVGAVCNNSVFEREVMPLFVPAAKS
jgi:succinate-acetate transporter protein